MADITGKNAYITWVYSGGTVQLHSDYRTISENPSIDLAECSAGADTNKTYIATLKDATIDWSGLLQADGTAMLAALAPGIEGTLKVYPEGTASGKPSKTYPAICMGARTNIPYNDVVEVSCTFQANGAWS
jgi:hypothetical protein